MSKQAHICCTLIISKQFHFCHFKASAYTNVDRLCAVFLYNIAVFISPLKLVAYWNTLVNFNSLKESGMCVNDEKLFFFMDAVAMLDCRKLLFWSRDLWTHAILHLMSKFRTNPQKRRRYIEKQIRIVKSYLSNWDKVTLRPKYFSL